MVQTHTARSLSQSQILHIYYTQFCPRRTSQNAKQLITIGVLRRSNQKFHIGAFRFFFEFTEKYILNTNRTICVRSVLRVCSGLVYLIACFMGLNTKSQKKNGKPYIETQLASENIGLIKKSDINNLIYK